VRAQTSHAEDWRGWLIAAALPVILALDLLIPSVVLLPFLALPVLAVAAISTPRATAVVAVLAFVTGLLAGTLGDHLGEADYWIRQAVLTVVGVVAALLARTRNRTVNLLTESETHYRLLAENSANVVVLSRDRVIVWVSPSVEDMVGWTPAELIGTHASDLIHFHDIDGLPVDRGPDAGRESLRLRMLDKSGEYRWIEVHRAPFVNDRGEQDGSVVSFRTIDSEVATEQELQRRATHDDLTGLLARGEAIEQLEAIVRNRRRPGADCSVMFCDLDAFKSINDTHGHQAGDTVLRTFAERLREAVRVEDVVARVGGDEFLVVLNGVHSLQEAMSMAQKVHLAVTRNPISIGMESVRASVSIGVTLVAAGETADSIITRADEAMYQSKRGGAGHVTAIRPPGALLGDAPPPSTSA